MPSFRNSMETAGASASVQELAKRLNVQSPISLHALIATYQIHRKYTQIGDRRSPLGRPISPGISVRSSGQEFLADFRGGQIKFTSDSGAVAIVTHQTVVRFRGIHCFGKSEAVDEPYAIVGVYAPDA